MDPIKIEKIQAINKYKKHQLLNNLSFYCLSALSCSLVFSSPFWYPSLKVFLFISLPKLASCFFSPKFFFIIGNLIVVFLVGESKVFSSKSSRANEIYNKSGTGSLQNLHICEDESGRRLEAKLEKCYASGEKMESIVFGENEMEMEKKNEDLDQEEELIILPVKELSKRADAYIARVNRQRMLEAKQLVYNDEWTK